ncbi:MAG TPA: hypothetical protein VN706_14215 [Gemmatimonadaceae bacterium]|nr:hypothetical protein [Gemmatimonadaceae bacterium]
MGHWKLVLAIIGLVGSASLWQHHHVDYRKFPPTVLIVGDARDTLNAAYAEYEHPDSTPFIEQGFCARSWVTSHPTWNTTIVRITSVVRSERNASPISVNIPCPNATQMGAGIVFHTHPPQQCVVKGNWQAWSECQPTSDPSVACKASWLDMADTLQHPGIPARFIVCGEDRFMLYHATDAL